MSQGTLGVLQNLQLQQDKQAAEIRTWAGHGWTRRKMRGSKTKKNPRSEFDDTAKTYNNYRQITI